MPTRQQWVAILSFLGATTMVISAAVALYFSYQEMKKYKVV